MSFLNPALLAGAALFVVPLVIHLLNRQRHQKRPWAAMEFLLRAYRKQRNRLRTENLLLLLLRCLVPIVLALAVARPLLQRAAGLPGGGTRHHVLVVDGSYSMGLRSDGGTTPFERARGLVGRLLDRFEEAPEQAQKITLVAAGVRPRFLVRGDLSLGAARGQWFRLQRPEDAAGDLTDALVQVADAIDEAGDADVQVYVFTDGQRRAMGRAFAEYARTAAPPEPAQPPDAAAFRDSVRDVLERLQRRDGTRVHWIDVGPFAGTRQGGTADNVLIGDLRIDQPAAVVRAPVDVVATLKNRGAATVTAEVTLAVDGGEPQRKVVTLPPGAEGEADFQVAFREPGRRKLHARLPGDGLEADDERFATVEVRDRLRVLLVDGAAGDDPLRTYRHLWRLILDPDPAALPTFAVEAVEPLALLGGRCDPARYDLTVLADVDRLNQRAAAALQQALRAGKGLLVAFGEKTDAESYNLHLHGDGPMPFRLTAARGGAPGSAVPRAPVLALPDHPLFREFEEPVYREVFQAIPVWRWLGVADGSLADGAEVPARLDDAERSPLCVVRPFGEGKAVFLLSAPGSEYRPDRWNRLDDPMVAYPLLHGLAKYLALPALDPFHVPIGAELACSLPARPVSAEVQRPDRDGGGKVPIAEDARALPGGRYALPPLGDTVYAGFYTVDLVLDRESGRESLTLPFAVNVDPEEGDLQYAAHDAVAAALGLDRVLTALPPEADAQADPGANDLGPSLLLATLLFVLAEAALARFVSVRRY
ncbi:MAG: VWA domain-containing protein [Planctomycetes bacterium]|nr:VWA domain-containing protein [Planctomycetota bacterium]